VTAPRLGPVHLAGPATPRGGPQHVRAHLAALEAAAMRVRAASDAESIHDLRVASRRIVAWLDAWSAALDPAATRRARRGLQRLRRRLSQTREREVLVEHLDELFAGEPLAVREAGLNELQRLERRVAAGRARAARRVKSRRTEHLRARLEDCVASFRGEPGALIAAAREHADARRIAAIETLTGAAEDDAALHRARIAVKRWRYAIEALGDEAGEARAATLKALRGLQHCLGAIHDAAVLRDHLSRRALRAQAKGRGDGANALASLREKAGQARWRALERLPAAVTDAGATRSI